jgi:hypothetical protein
MAPAWKAMCKGNLIRRASTSVIDEPAGATEDDSAIAAELPVSVVIHILKMLDGDTATLCSAACVSTVWRDAAKEAYTMISVGALRSGLNYIWWAPSPLALRMNGDVLSRLVNLAGASLTHLNISGAVQVTDDDLLVLRLPACPSLKKVSMMSTGGYVANDRRFHMTITGSGVLAALGGRKLRCLQVLGIKYASPSSRYLKHKKTLIKDLRAIVRKPRQPDVNTVCGNCERLVTDDTMHGCMQCEGVWCDMCETNSDSLCDDCKMEEEWYEDEEDAHECSCGTCRRRR